MRGGLADYHRQVLNGDRESLVHDVGEGERDVASLFRQRQQFQVERTGFRSVADHAALIVDLHVAQ